MEFNKLEKESGFAFLYKLVDSNKDKTFEFTTLEDDILEVSFDMAFEDDDNSTDATDLSGVTFHTMSFEITGIVKNSSKKYSVGHVILINPYMMPKSYKLK